MSGFSCRVLGAGRMSYKLKIYFFALAAILILTQISTAAPFFRGTSLMNIPTAYVPEQGIFNVGTHLAIYDQERDELAVRLDFGIFNFVELGLTHLKLEDQNFVMGNLKLLLIRESGMSPAVSIGVDNFGEKIRDGSESYKRSIYGVLSKQFNLPLIHIISGHLGIGNRRYVSEDSPGKYLRGVFVGLGKDMQVSSLNSRLRLMFEVDGRDFNLGTRYMMHSGLSLNFAVSQLSSAPDGLRYYIGINFTNEPVMNDIDQAAKQALKAVKIVNEALSDVGK